MGCGHTLLPVHMPYATCLCTCHLPMHAPFARSLCACHLGCAHGHRVSSLAFPQCALVGAWAWACTCTCADRLSGSLCFWKHAHMCALTHCLDVCAERARAAPHCCNRGGAAARAAAPASSAGGGLRVCYGVHFFSWSY